MNNIKNPQIPEALSNWPRRSADLDVLKSIELYFNFSILIKVLHMKSILHFQHVFPLPEHGSLRPYEHPKAPLAKKKNKSKMTKFTYYRSPQGIIKVLFVDDDHYIDQGMYPFTDPSGTTLITQEKCFPSRTSETSKECWPPKQCTSATSSKSNQKDSP